MLAVVVHRGHRNALPRKGNGEAKLGLALLGALEALESGQVVSKKGIARGLDGSLKFKFLQIIPAPGQTSPQSAENKFRPTHEDDLPHAVFVQALQGRDVGSFVAKDAADHRDSNLSPVRENLVFIGGVGMEAPCGTAHAGGLAQGAQKIEVCGFSQPARGGGNRVDVRLQVGNEVGELRVMGEKFALPESFQRNGHGVNGLLCMEGFR